MRRVVVLAAMVLALCLVSCDQSSSPAPEGAAPPPPMPAPGGPAAGAPAGMPAAPSAPAPAAAAAAAPGTDPYTAMADLLKFTDEQRAALTKAVAARTQLIRDWEKTGQPQAQAVFAERQQARTAGDTEKDETLTKQFKELNAKHSADMTAADQAITVILTPDQVKVWDVHMLLESLLSAYERVQLTDAQKTEIRKRVDAVSAAYLAADTKGRGAISQQLHDGVMKEVLTKDQREMAMRPMGPGGHTRHPGGGPGGAGGGTPASAPANE